MLTSFPNWPWSYFFGVALETLLGTVWAQLGPKSKSWGSDRAMHFRILDLELSFGVALEKLVGTVWAQQLPRWKFFGFVLGGVFLQFCLRSNVWGCA